jgi:ribosome-associated translation inhibitor RaiA
MYASLSQALDKLEAQAHKQSGKQKAGIKTKAAHPDATAVEPAELETEETEG